MIKAPAVGRKSGLYSLEWEDKGYTKVSQIFVYYRSIRVCAVQFQLVDPDGSLVLSSLHGKDADATCFSAIHLDCETEFVTGLSGYGKNGESLLCLKITTNIRKYGPFGDPNLNPDYETYDVQLGDIEAFGGFHGTSSVPFGLMSVGLFFKSRDRLPLVSSSGQLKKEPY